MSREMKDSGIAWVGQIPTTWKSIPLKYITEYNKEDLREGTDPEFQFEYIDIGSVTYGRGISGTEIIRFKNSPSRARRKVNAGDVILSTVRTYLKAVAKIEPATIPQIASTGFIVLTAKKSVLPNFLFYGVLANSFICNVEAHSTGISYPAINASQVVSFKIPVPGIEEQAQIADFLDKQCTEIDSALVRTRASIEEYKKLKQAVITQAVTKGIRGKRPMKDSGVEWIGSIPEDWEVRKGKTLFRETNERSQTGEEELLTVSHITGITPRNQKNVNMFMSESLVDYKICHVNDIAANTMWMWQGAIGVSKFHGVISPSYNTYRQINAEYDSEYLDYMLRIKPLVDTYNAYSTGITASRLRLYPQQFLSIFFPIPPMAQQKEIADYLDRTCSEIDTLIAKKEQYLVELENYKKSLIYEYVTGKKEAPNHGA